MLHLTWRFNELRVTSARQKPETAAYSSPDAVDAIKVILNRADETLPASKGTHLLAMPHLPAHFHWNPSLSPQGINEAIRQAMKKTLHLQHCLQVEQSVSIHRVFGVWKSENNHFRLSDLSILDTFDEFKHFVNACLRHRKTVPSIIISLGTPTMLLAEDFSPARRKEVTLFDTSS